MTHSPAPQPPKLSIGRMPPDANAASRARPLLGTADAPPSERRRGRRSQKASRDSSRSLPLLYGKQRGVTRLLTEKAPNAMRVKLTTSGIAALERPSDKDRAFAWDSGVAGFGVIAFASGKKTYIAQYREDGRSRRVAIGDVATMTLVEARSKARTLLAGARKKTRRRRAHRLESSSLERSVMDHEAHVSLRLHKKLLARIDKWTADHAHAAPGGLSRSAAIRMLIENSLSSEGRYLPGGYRIRFAIEGTTLNVRRPRRKLTVPPLLNVRPQLRSVTPRCSLINTFRATTRPKRGSRTRNQVRCRFSLKTVASGLRWRAFQRRRRVAEKLRASRRQRQRLPCSQKIMPSCTVWKSST
jgi:Arm DNA-binding domain